MVANDVVLRCYGKNRKILFRSIFNTTFITQSKYQLIKTELDEPDKLYVLLCTYFYFN